MIKKAVFTMVKNEKWFLPIWLNYYSKFFNECDIYVLDHQSTDNSIENCKNQYSTVNFIQLQYEPFDDVFKINEIKKLQKNLLEKYDVVVYSDPDELIVPIDSFNLSEYLDRFNSSNNTSIKCDGWELIHLPDRGEPEIDLTKSILSQRKYWFHSEKWYSKVLISKEPLNWSPGLHTITNNTTSDNNLKLIHLHRIDYDLAYLKNIYNTQFKRPPGMTLGGHSFIVNPEEFHNHFWGISEDNIEEIPESIIKRDLF